MLDFEQQYKELADYTQQRNRKYKEDSLQLLKKKRANAHPANFLFHIIIAIFVSFWYINLCINEHDYENFFGRGKKFEFYSTEMIFFILAVGVFLFAALKLLKIVVYMVVPKLYDTETAILHDKEFAVGSLISWEEYYKTKNNFLKIFFKNPILDFYPEANVYDYTLKNNNNILKISFYFKNENNADVLLLPTGHYLEDFLSINVLPNSEIEKFDYFEYIEKYFEIRTDKRGSTSKFLEANQLDIEQIDNIAKQINLPIALSFSKTQSSLYVLIDLNRVFAPLLKQVNLDTLKQAVEHPRGLRNQLIAIREMSELILKISKNELSSDT